jgi:hypothetical protein
MSLSSRFAKMAPKGNKKADNKKLSSISAASKAKRDNLVNAKRSGTAPLPASVAAKEGKKKAQAKAKAEPKKKINIALKGGARGDGKKGNKDSAKKDKLKAKKLDAKKKNKKNKKPLLPASAPADKGALDMELDTYMEAAKKKAEGK